jgi:hypothetical protein
VSKGYRPSADRAESAYSQAKKAADARQTASTYTAPGRGYSGSSTASAAANRGKVAIGTPYAEVLKTRPVGSAQSGMVTNYGQYFDYVSLDLSQGGNLVNNLPRWQYDLFFAVGQARGGLSSANSVWDEYAARSAYESGFGRNLSPTDLLLQDLMDGRVSLGDRDPSGGGYRSYGGGGFGGGGGSSSVSLTDPTSARGLLMQTMRSMLGRNPNEDEYTTFLEALNEAERANPRTVAMEGNTAVQAGGLDPGMIAMEYVEGLEEFDSIQGQRAFDSFMQVLGS